MATDPLADYLLPGIVLIIFLIVGIYLAYLLISSNFERRTQESPYIECAVSSCATNIYSGFKRCPPVGGTVFADPLIEVCNSRFLCDNPLTPYAVQADGSTNLSGVCEPEVTCACTREARCPQYILSLFTASNGTPYSTLTGQRLTFPQTSLYSTNGITTDQPPISYQEDGRTFCTAPLAWLPLSSPGCNFATSNDMSYEELVTCMGLPRQCNGASGNPCLQGTLAIISANPSALTQADIDVVQYGCVAGTSCPCGQVAIYDTNFNGIVCRELQ